MLAQFTKLILTLCSALIMSACASQPEQSQPTHQVDPAQNLEQSEAFLTQLKASDSAITTTSSGLMYKEVKAGHGCKPTADSQVRVSYEARLHTGKLVDSSGQTAVNLPLTRVIKGWQEALPMMQEGAVWDLYIHPSLAYGNRNSGTIPANSAMTFRIQLHKAGTCALRFRRI